MKTNHIALLLDSSGSMSSLRDLAIKQFNAKIESIRQASYDSGIRTSVKIYTFNSQVQQLMDTQAEFVRPLTYREYNPHGGTALYEAVNQAVGELQSRGSIDRLGDASYFVEVITDGENTSNAYALPYMQRNIETLQRTDRWTFAFMVPSGYGAALIRTAGLRSGNVAEWDQTEVGLERAVRTSRIGTQNFFAARSAGKSSVDTYYRDVNLHDVTSADLLKMPDHSAKFRVYEVKNEAPIKEFTIGKTHREYVIGQTYYQLVKTELVRHDRELYIIEKGKRAVYGGADARRILKLPIGVDTKVNPVDLSKYEVYIESRSVNRKLPRGSKVIIDTTRVSNRQPTWVG